MHISDPPNRVVLDVNSSQICDGHTDCTAEVVIGHSYRFTCNASGSHPASRITWLVDTQGRRGVVRSEIVPHSSHSHQDEDKDWDTSSQILLQILPTLNSSSVTCRVLFPDNNTYEEISVKLKLVLYRQGKRVIAEIRLLQKNNRSD